MNYALIISALEKHAGIAQRSLDFFRERRMGVQYATGIAMLEEATRALAEAKKMRDMYAFQMDLYKQGIITALPNPIPPDTSDEDLPASSVEFPDKQLRCKHENVTDAVLRDGSGRSKVVCADCGVDMANVSSEKGSKSAPPKI